METFGIFITVAVVLMILDIVDLDNVIYFAMFLGLLGAFDGDDDEKVRPTKTEVNVTVQEQTTQASKKKTKERETVAVAQEVVKEPETDNEPVRDWKW